MQNAECKISFPLILLRRLFFLAARHSANKFALCARSASSVFRFLFSVNPTPISYLLSPNLKKLMANRKKNKRTRSAPISCK